MTFCSQTGTKRGIIVKKILINKEAWQVRVAVLDESRLTDIYYDTFSKQDLDRCFFKGRVAKVFPGIQTAFVDIGQSRAGFLHITEIDRTLAAEKITEHLQSEADGADEEIEPADIKSNLNIDKIFTEGEDILVQVIKEPIHEKGAKLTTCFTLPGKFLVLMPNISQIGISKKIEDREERNRLKDILATNLPQGMGAIVRTTAEGRSNKDIQKDLALLINSWNTIQKKFKKAKPCELLYQDLPVALRAVRDHLDDDTELAIVDDQSEQNSIFKFVKHLTPEHANKIRFYQGPPSLFERFNVEAQIEAAMQKKVSLRSGGSLIIESTEAMTVIDVNTGKFTGSKTHEDTVLKTNLEAADEIVTQLRLRNIGGLIVIDFIDMAMPSNRQKLSRLLEKTLKERDKFQSVALKISEFGLVQMTRKRSGKTLLQQMTNVCPACSGSGFTRSISTVCYNLLRKFSEDARRKSLAGNLLLMVSNEIFDYIVHNEYQAILNVEKQLGCKITLENNEAFDLSQFTVQDLNKK
jgi:ribonuclease G